jgi:opacity protein-like surface antigen
MSMRQITSGLLVLLLFAYPSRVHAQGGAIASGSVGVEAGNGSTDLAISGGVGYRFNRALGLGVELTDLPRLDPGTSGGVRPLVVCCDLPNPRGKGHATFFTTNVRVEIPTSMRRVIPFVVGGGGVASVTQSYSIIYYLPAVAGSAAAAIAYPTPVPGILPGPQYISSTTVAMALTLGGGASVLVTDHLAVDADLRAFQLLGEAGGSMGRFSVGASYRF